jgi:hypothetical protein
MNIMMSSMMMVIRHCTASTKPGSTKPGNSHRRSKLSTIEIQQTAADEDDHDDDDFGNVKEEQQHVWNM